MMFTLVVNNILASVEYVQSGLVCILNDFTPNTEKWTPAPENKFSVSDFGACRSERFFFIFGHGLGKRRDRIVANKIIVCWLVKKNAAM